MHSRPLPAFTFLSLTGIFKGSPTWPRFSRGIQPRMYSCTCSWSQFKDAALVKNQAAFIWRILCICHNKPSGCGPLLVHFYWSCGIIDTQLRIYTAAEPACVCARTKSSNPQTEGRKRASDDGGREGRSDRFNPKRWGAIRSGEGGCLLTWGQYSQTSFYNKYIFNLCSFINQKNHFKMNCTLLSLLVALTVLYHEFVSLCNSSPASLHTKYVLYEPSFITACQLLTVSLFSLELWIGIIKWFFI